VRAVAGSVGAIRPGTPQANAHRSPFAFRILTLPFQQHIVARRGVLLFNLTQPGSDARQAGLFRRDRLLNMSLLSAEHPPQVIGGEVCVQETGDLTQGEA